MFGYFDESGKPALIKNTSFIVSAVWGNQEFLIDRMMRGLHSRLHSEGYSLSEVKGSNLNLNQKKNFLERIALNKYPFFKADIHVMDMNTLAKDFRLYSHKSLSESCIHQSLLYSMICNKLSSSNDDSFYIFIDVRYSLPKPFFRFVEGTLRKKYPNKKISITRETSHKKKGIQLADLLSNIYYSSAGMASNYDLEGYVELTSPNSNEFDGMLTNYESLGGF